MREKTLVSRVRRKGDTYVKGMSIETLTQIDKKKKRDPRERKTPWGAGRDRGREALRMQSRREWGRI